MSGNSLGLLFSVTSFGESHGPAIGCVVDGCPPGMEISAEEIQLDNKTRGMIEPMPGFSPHLPVIAVVAAGFRTASMPGDWPAHPDFLLATRG